MNQRISDILCCCADACCELNQPEMEESLCDSLSVPGTNLACSFSSGAPLTRPGGRGPCGRSWLRTIASVLMLRSAPLAQENDFSVQSYSRYTTVTSEDFSVVLVVIVLIFDWYQARRSQAFLTDDYRFICRLFSCWSRDLATLIWWSDEQKGNIRHHISRFIDCLTIVSTCLRERTQTETFSDVARMWKWHSSWGLKPRSCQRSVLTD